MTQICIIDINNFNAQMFDYNNLINSNEKIFDYHFEKYLTYKKTQNNEELMDIIITELKLNINLTWNGYTETIYETPCEMYQMIYVDIDDKNAHILCNDNENIDDIKNMLACYLTSEKKNIHGKCILLKYNFDSNDSCTLCDIIYDDILYVLHRKIVHTCVYVTHKGDVKNMRFMYNPCESDKTNKYKINYVTFVDINILIYILVDDESNDKFSDENYLNKKMNILYENKIYGDVFVSLFNNGNTFVDLDDDLFSKILFLFENKQMFSDVKRIHNKNDKLSLYRTIIKYYSMLHK